MMQHMHHSKDTIEAPSTSIAHLGQVKFYRTISQISLTKVPERTTKADLREHGLSFV